MYADKRNELLLRIIKLRRLEEGGGGIFTYNWIEQTTAPSALYANMEAATDFSVLAYTRQTQIDGQEGAYFSTDNGATWTRKVTDITWPAGIYSTDIVLAADNPNIVFLANRGTPGTDYIWRTTNGGDSWTAVSPLKLWTGVSCSANGSNVVATELTTSNVWVSYDTGSNWIQKTTNPGSASWTRCLVSANGTFMLASTTTASNVSISYNSGSNWSNVVFAPANRTIYRSVSSSNGQIVMINVLSNAPRISRDFGSNWSNVNDVSFGFCPESLAMSRNGSIIAYAASNTPIFVSQDEGQTWQSQTDPGIRAWNTLAMDGAGSNVIAGIFSGRVWYGTV
jgi:hypothetical protein